jgi:ubiquitin-activating enzyme E1
MWAKAFFEDIFGQRLAVLKEGLEASAKGAGYVRRWVRKEILLGCAPGSQEAKVALETLQKANEDLGSLFKTSKEHRYEWAGALFAEHFDGAVAKLLEEHPADSLDDEGTPFWSGTRVIPERLTLSDDIDVLNFLKYASLLRGRCVGEEAEVDAEVLLAAAQRGFESYKAENTTLAAEISRFEIGAARLGEMLIRPIVEFEKDEPLAHHVDFVAAAANLRGRSFHIDRVDTLRAKQIAGSVVPAIATTTAVVSALATLEFLKLLQDDAAFKNTFANLRSNVWYQSEPFPAETWTLPSSGREVSEWTRDEIRLLAPSETFGDLVRRVEKTCNADLISISRVDDDALLYLSFNPTDMKMPTIEKLLSEEYPINTRAKDGT